MTKLPPGATEIRTECVLFSRPTRRHTGTKAENTFNEGLQNRMMYVLTNRLRATIRQRSGVIHKVDNGERFIVQCKSR